MMNNCWFRVGIHHDEEKNQLRFEHPTMPGTQSGGWMARVAEEGQDPRFPSFTKAAETDNMPSSQPQPPKEKVDVRTLMEDPAKALRIVTAEELREHANEEDPWFVLNGHVYEGTPFLKEHPGGAESITLVAGEDVTEDFMGIHSLDAKRRMLGFHIGKLAEGALETATDESPSSSSADGAFLNPKVWKPSKLISRTPISHDSRIFRFALDHPDQTLGLPIGQHVYLRIKDAEGNVVVQRAYTPFSGNELKGYVDILVKVYASSSAYPAGGKMTSLLEKMEAGKDELEMKGPLGGFTFLGNSTVRWRNKEHKVRKLALICGGSGITPIWSTIKGLVECNDSKETECWLLNGNRTEADILARSQIDDLQRRFKESGRRFDLWHVLSGETAAEWDMGRGRINVDLMRKHLPPPPKVGDDGELDTLALVCGPPAMEEAVKKGLAELGWDVPNTVVFF